MKQQEALPRTHNAPAASLMRCKAAGDEWHSGGTAPHGREDHENKGATGINPRGSAGKRAPGGFTPLEKATVRERSSLTGFTLAELLLSVIILSFGLVAVIGSYYSAAAALNSSQNRLRAIELLKSRLIVLRQECLEQNKLEPVALSEDLSLNNRPATYSLEVSPLEPSDDLDLSEKLSLVKLSLAWKERSIPKDVSISTYLEKRP